MWWVYILECQDQSLYTGITNNLGRRFVEHRERTAHYTSYNPSVRVLYKEPFRTKPAALRREAQIKGWTRRKKLALINGDADLLKRS